MIETITGFNQAYYDLIGKDCVDSWLTHWPKDMKLTCYVEEMSIPNHERINQISFEQLDPDYVTLQNEQGFHSSVKKFAKKAYSFMHAMKHSQAHWILWVDADVITLDRIPQNFWNNLLDPKYLSVYMGVTYTQDKIGNPGNWLVPETGVFAVNTQHADFDAFRKEYCNRYHQRNQSDLRRFYDNDVFGIALRQVSAKCLDLCQDFKKPYKTPIKHTVLGPYLHHYKAKHSKATYAEVQ